MNELTRSLAAAPLFVLGCLAYHVGAQEPPAPETPEVSQSALSELIEPLVKAHEGDVAVAVRHLTTNESYELNAQRPQATASLIKLPIMIEAYRQANEDGVGLYRQLDVREEDMVPGSGILTTHFSPGTRISLRDAIRLMIAFSDNTATNLVLDQISIRSTCDTMQMWGYPETRINSKVYRRDTSIDLERSKRYGLGSTTASDMVGLLVKLHADELITPSVCKDMLAHLAACDDKLKFPALLPKGTKLAHKTGSVDKVRTAAGIIETPSGPVALCVLTENNRDTRWSDDNAGDRLCAEIAKITYDHFANSTAKNPSTTDQPESSVPSVLKIGADGDLVEALQRTLNARTEPSPQLSVDGDFGPGTEAAVKAFQDSKQLAATGVVDNATWHALGPLIMEETPLPDPDTINGETLATRSADDPYGVPAVTCKAWAIANGTTGEVLWEEQGDQPRDIASTTKIMTAFLVMRYCENHPEALDEIILFSENADKTVGSTSGVRTEEKVRVGDLLYGLMLPSGNDASVAFAEHFGQRLGDDNDKDEIPYQRFIGAMNRAAGELQMSHTHYVNPHGLTAEGHQSTPNDLIKLTIAARQLPLFRTVTACRQFGCRVDSATGYQRNLKWENTNQLLPIEGYNGVKTGTTDAAGACLISAGTHGDRELIVVVLGAAAPAARYTDARNLFAWAWREILASEEKPSE